MEDILKKVFEKNFYTSRGLIAGVILIILSIIIPFDNLLEKGISCFQTRCLVYLLLLLIWGIVWWCLREYLPKNPKGKVGLLFAIVTESEKQKIRIKKDLASGISKLLDEYHLLNTIKVIVLEDFKANRTSEVLQKYILKEDEIERNYTNLDKNEKEKLLKRFTEYKNFDKLKRRVNCHFYIWGNIKERQDAENKYYIDLEALVIHKHLEAISAELIKKEFVAIFPKEISFPEKFEFKGFQVTSDWIFIAATYIIGIAALLSNDQRTAYKLHKNIPRELNKYKPLPPNLYGVAKTVKRFLVLELLFNAQFAYQKGNLISAKNFIEEAILIDNKDYNVLVAAAYFSFNIKRDVSVSLEYLKKASAVENIDYTWLYNRAFLYMYIGEYEKGFNDYKKLLDVSFVSEPKIVEECIEYDINLSKTEPNKYQLLFILGFLFYFKKRDLMNALRYFKLFKDKACSNKDYDYLCKRVDTYLVEINRELLTE